MDLPNEGICSHVLARLEVLNDASVTHASPSFPQSLQKISLFNTETQLHQVATNMSSANAPSSGSSKPTPNSLKLDEQTTEQQPAQSKVSGLEEDDEFEEFAVQGMQCSLHYLGAR